jgi:hypothetical protein
MSTDELRRATRQASAAGRRRLGALLRAAAVPARPGELAGEETALQAFRTATLVPLPPAPKRTGLARMLTLKVGALCVAALGVGGVAVAASAGVLPVPPLLHSGISDKETTQPVPAPVANPPGRANRPAAPSLVSRCQDYLARDTAQREEALNGQMRDLLAAAGKLKVDDYCTSLVRGGPSAGGPPSGAPSTPDGHATNGGGLRSNSPHITPSYSPPAGNPESSPAPGAGNLPVSPPVDVPSELPTPGTQPFGEQSAPPDTPELGLTGGGS